RCLDVPRAGRCVFFRKRACAFGSFADCRTALRQALGFLIQKVGARFQGVCELAEHEMAMVQQPWPLLAQRRKHALDYFAVGQCRFVAHQMAWPWLRRKEAITVVEVSRL